MKKQKFPPEYERAVLSALVQDTKFLKEAVTVVDPKFLDDGIHKSAITVIRSTYLRTRQTPSKVGFLSAMVEEERRRIKVRKGEEDTLIVEPCRKLTEEIFQQAPEMADVKASFLDFCKLREMSNALTDSIDKLEGGEIDASGAHEAIRRTHQRLNSTGQGGQDFFLDIDEFPAMLENMKQTTYTTGFPGLDRKMGGGAGAGTLTTFIAPPKGGKSMILCNICHANALRGRCVVYFTLEINEKKIAKRFASRISKVSLNKMHEQTQYVMEKCAQFWDTTKARIIVKEFMTGACTVDTMRSYLYWLEADRGVKPQVIAIDYGDLVKPTEKQKEIRFSQAEAYTEMRALAQEFHVAIFTASQCNREGTSKNTIRMQDIAEAFAKCAISDHIISICKTEDEEREKKGRLFFAGSREAESGGIVPFRFDWDTCLMQESNDIVAPRGDF